MLRAIVFICIYFWVLLGAFAHAGLSSNAVLEIEYLKSQVAQSSCVFTRNHVNYKGSEAVTHINRKQAHFKNSIMSAEDFVRLAATKSEMSGLNYIITCNHQSEQLGDWLLNKLKLYRQQATH